MDNPRLVTYSGLSGSCAGVAFGEVVVDWQELAGAHFYSATLDALNDWENAESLLKGASATDKVEGRPVGAITLLAPVLYPPAIYCAGANYADHMQEMARVQNIPLDPDAHTLGLKPWHFIKSSRCVAAPGSVVPLPKYSTKVDWEAELVAVIGRRAKDVPMARALDYVAGYTIADDLSARDLMQRMNVSATSPFKYDWIGQKCFDGACPLGPWIVPASYIPDPQNLSIKLWVNDVLKQDSHTSKMIFSVAEQIEHLSSRMTLYPGDLILTGTPAGVGMARGEFLKAGDVVRIEIERIGTLTNTFV